MKTIEGHSSLNYEICELNGLFHYKKIFSNENFEKTCRNDKGKITLAKEKGLNLEVIDISKFGISKKDLLAVYNLVVQVLKPYLTSCSTYVKIDPE